MTDPQKDTQRAIAAAKLILDGRDPRTDSSVRLDACRLLIEGCEAVDPATDAAVNNAKRAIKDALVVLGRMQVKTPIDWA